MRIRAGAALTLLGVLLAASVVRADGILRDGFGAISGGRGATNLAHGDNGAVLYDNPAGILKGEGSSLLEVRADFYQFQLRYEDPENDEEEFFPLAVLPEITYVRRSANRRWAAGIGLLAPGGFLSNYHLNNPVLGRNEYTASASLLKLLPAVAYQATDRLRVGATLGIAWSRVDYDGPFFAQSGALAGTPTLTDWDAQAFAPTWSVGLQYELGQTTIGFAYLSATRLDLDGDLRTRIPLPGGGELKGDFDLDVDFRWPRSAGIGFTRPFGAHHRLSVDVIWFDWSDAFDELVLELSDPTNPALAGLRRDTFPLGWNDSVSLRIGYERTGSRWGTLRLGYVFHENPIPDSALTALIPAHFEHMVSFGLSRRRGPWVMSFAFQVSFAPTKHVSSSTLAGGDFDDSRVQGFLYAALLSFTYHGSPETGSGARAQP